MLVLWAILVVAGVVVDVATGALVGVWVSTAALGAGLVAGLGLPRSLQASAFVVLSVVLLGAIRPLALRHRRTGTMPPALLLGKLGTVVDAVDEHLASGRVVIEGIPYVARCAPGSTALPAGSAARVCAVEAGDIVVEGA